jgi:hypothetical protein
MKTIVQKISKNILDEFALAEKYYSIISIINNLNLTQREIELVAYTSIVGNITQPKFRQEFCDLYNTSNATINNMTSKLRKMYVMVKAGKNVKINPILILDFNSNLNLVITFNHGETK